MAAYCEDKNFEKENYSDSIFEIGEYENCKFIGCDFSNVDLKNCIFDSSVFIDCNLTNVKLKNTTFSDHLFVNCKLLGLHFDDCKEFGFAANFENCNLNLASFFKRKIKGTKFKNCSLHEVDFTEADLSLCLFDNCDFRLATFENTNIEKADFRSSMNYRINPSTNKIKKAKFSLQGVIGLLDQYDIVIED
jgi:uncharacterized protein YjbI with pentapeptide repeats